MRKGNRTGVGPNDNALNQRNQSIHRREKER